MRGQAPVALLRRVLENLRSPERLDSHPWTASLTVQEAVSHDSRLDGKSPGTQLALAIGELFREMMPVTPPHDGKRLDTRWGRFGILAANYFAPLLYGRLYPHTMREAWRRIDPATLLFVYGKTADELTPEQVRAYRLVGDEVDFAANSTISDWHRNGLQDLSNLFLSHEKHLSLASRTPSVVFAEAAGSRSRRETTSRVTSRRWRSLSWGLGAVVLVGVLTAVIALGVKGWQVYQLAQPVRNDIVKLGGLNVASLDSDGLDRAGPLLEQTHGDVEALQAAASPWLWLGSNLGWVPVYGGDLKYAGDLLEVTSGSSEAASLAYENTFSIWKFLRDHQVDLKASDLSGLLLYVQPGLVQSQEQLTRAEQARQRIVTAELSPGTRSWVTRADGYLRTLDEGLSLAVALPRLLGASSEGPKTYLILVQNEDELRPTGGFITAVGKLVVWNGELISWDIVDSYTVDDINKAYPPAPWQMRSFMNIPIMTFRDANWFADYPTTVKWAEYLYAYSNAYSVNGVVAIDQHVLKSLLAVTGPLEVKGIDTTVSADNVQEVMRTQKVPPDDRVNDPNWYRKQFMNPIAEAILNRVLSGTGISWAGLIQTVMGELDQRHVLVQLDDPVAARLVAARGWDGSIARDQGDLLAVIDTNVGYNKTNAAVSSELVYNIDLSNVSAPTSSLQVFQRNAAGGPAGQCEQRPAGVDRSTLEYWYAIDRCYYDYLRVYVPAGSQLASATPHAVTHDEMVMLDQDVPGRVDNLDDKLPGLRGFGTLLVVPIGGALETDFQFNLPPGILQAGPAGNELTYQLKVQKQPGTVATPVTIRVDLPEGSRIASVSPSQYVQSGDTLQFELKLVTDVSVRIEFQP